MSWQSIRERLTLGVACVSLVASLGCHAHTGQWKHHKDYSHHHVADAPVPKELNKVTLPPYVIETPDILLIDAIRVIPLPPYRVEPLDVLSISGTNVFESAPIQGMYPVEPDGTVNLGPAYGGSIRVADLTTDEIRNLLEQKVRQYAKNAIITVSLAQSRGVQQIAGQHIVRPDGTVGLGSYGAVYVAGMTLAQAKMAIEAHLSRYLYRPEVSVDVYAFNSKFYYVITDMAGYGENVARLPHTGNETVLDAVANIGGLSQVSSKKIWIARPAPAECGGDQILPVDWKGITRRGQVATNYQVLPGDRIYILSQPMTKFDTYVGRILSPFNRIMGSVILGASMVELLGPNQGGGNGAVVSPVIGAGF